MLYERTGCAFRQVEKGPRVAMRQMVICIICCVPCCEALTHHLSQHARTHRTSAVHA